MINRIWQHHFGEGFVPTPDDFGMMSEPPSHPELLDYLAMNFMTNGWSIKKIHRLDHALQRLSGKQRRTIRVMRRPIPATACSGARISAGWSSSRCAIRCWPSAARWTLTCMAGPWICG